MQKLNLGMPKKIERFINIKNQFIISDDNLGLPKNLNFYY